MSEVGSDVVDAVIAELDRVDPGAGGDARTALDDLTAGEGPGVITQARVQRWVWYSLPVKYMTDVAHHHQIAAAAGLALERLGLGRYAEICRSPITTGILDAWDESSTAGWKAYRAADIGSGVCPPATETFEFGGLMGMVEANVWDGVADMLELSIVAGDLTPGARGWKKRQADLMGRWLTNPANHHGGATPIQAVRTERFETWMSRKNSPTRSEVIAPLRDQLLTEAEVPTGIVGEATARLEWLLAQFADGQPLTQTGNLNRAFVQAAAKRFEYPDYFNTPSSEYDVYDLHLVKEFALQRRLIRKNKTKLVLTASGRAAVNDPAKLWRHITQGLISTNPFDAATGVIALAVLANNTSITRDTLVGIINQVVTNDGWRSPTDGQPPDERTLIASIYATTNLARALGLNPTGHDTFADTKALSAGGQAAALDALRHHITGPQTSPF